MTGLDGWRRAAAGAMALCIASLGSRRLGGGHQDVDPRDRGLSGIRRLRGRGVQEDPSGREHHLRELPQRGLQDARSRSRSPAPSRPTCSSTGPARMRRGWCATGWRSTSPSSATPRAVSRHSLQRRLAVVLHVRRQATTACRPTPSPNTSTTTRRSSPSTTSRRPTTFDGLLQLCSDIRAIDPVDRAVAARQLRALEAQPRHHHAQRARAGRRRRPRPTTR